MSDAGNAVTKHYYAADCHFPGLTDTVQQQQQQQRGNGRTHAHTSSNSRAPAADVEMDDD
eukprot:1277-Heterococcus_DN1.PRE.1